LASGSDDNLVKIWNLRTYSKEATLGEYADTKVYSVSLSPDGSKLASGCDHNIIKIWDL
jgi:WD40 repeat protein